MNSTLLSFPHWLLLTALGAAACSDSKSPDGASGGSGDTTGNAGTNAGVGGSGNAGNGSGGSSGSVNEGGSAGLGLNQGGSGGMPNVQPAIPVVPDPAKDCGQASNAAVPALKLTPFMDGFTRPVYLTQPPGDTERLFVVEKPGTIRIVRGGQLVEAP